MYNRLFTKILDSSIWLEPLHIRVVWITLLAAMDEDGVACFACPANVARRAGVDLAQAEEALECLMAPDPNSSDPENEGRRLDKIDGGYLVLNASKYRALFSREIQRQQTRVRVAKHRAKKNVTQCNVPVTDANDRVTQSEAEAEAEAEAEEEGGDIAASPLCASAQPLPPELRIWNQLCGSLPKAMTTSKARLRHLAARRRDPFFVEHFEEAVRLAAESRFCCGENDRGWKGSIDWLLRPDTVAKLVEGQFANAAKANNGKGHEEHYLVKDAWKMINSLPKYHEPRDG